MQNIEVLELISDYLPSMTQMVPIYVCSNSNDQSNWRLLHMSYFLPINLDLL